MRLRMRLDSFRSFSNKPANCIHGFSFAAVSSAVNFASTAEVTKAVMVCPFRAAVDLARRNRESGNSRVVFTIKKSPIFMGLSSSDSAIGFRIGNLFQYEPEISVADLLKISETLFCWRLCHGKPPNTPQER